MLEKGEERGLHGGTRALSSVHMCIDKQEKDVSETRILEISHFAEPVIADWKCVANQRVFVWARFRNRPCETVAGAIFVHPDPGSDALQHPLVLYAAQVQTQSNYRRIGIASALYGHLDLLGYHLMKSPVVMGNSDGATPNADRLWDRLHPGYEDDLEAGRLELLRYTFDQVSLMSIVSRFGKSDDGPLFGLLKPLDEFAWGFEDWPSI